MRNDTEWDGLWNEGFIAWFAKEEREGNHPLQSSFNGLGYVVFKRTYARQIEGQDRTEEWFETCARVVSGAQAIGAGFTEKEAQRLFLFMWETKAIPGGRMLWQLGTDNVKRLGADSLVNCWYTCIETPDDFRFLFNQLMLGGGVGFNVTEKGVSNLPFIDGGKSTLVEGFDADFVVPDNRDGWGELLLRVIKTAFGVDGHDHEWTYSVDAIRPEGAPIKTFGGTASGPGILLEGIEKIQGIFGAATERAEGRLAVLSTVDVLDICNVIGSIVVSGNVRRSAQIALGDALDQDYLDAKRWDRGGIPAYRAMSNNTVMVNDIDDLPESFWEGYTAGRGEPYGLFNLPAAQNWGRMGEWNPDPSIEGVNPCGEIPLGNRESCNLAELVVPKFDSYDEMRDAAILLYKVQKAVAALPFLDPQTNIIAHTNMRLGLGVTGLAMASYTQLGYLKGVYEDLQKFDRHWSGLRGYNTSIRLTTVKPSGTLSLLAGVTPGVHAGYSKHHIRRVRMAANDGLVEWCRSQGYPVEFAMTIEGTTDPKTVVVEFPAMFDDDTNLASTSSALQQLEMAHWAQTNWADNAVSVTVTYRPDELADIRVWLKENWMNMKSVSFLPYSEHGFVQAPLEPIDSEDYKARLNAIAGAHEAYEGLSSLGDEECATGACPIR